MNSTVYLSQKRDLPILQFLWRWKVATTLALAKRFFAEASLKRAYDRLSKLKRAEFISAKCNSEGKNFVWTLTKKGFSAIRPNLPALREEGYKSEAIYHDALVTAIHLGDFLQNAPSGVEVFTEQQLRRLHFDFYPSWVPLSDSRRSDGYWKIPNGENAPRVLALEVELSLKPNREYEVIADFYSRLVQIERVFWLVENVTSANRIWQSLIKENPQSKNFLKHSFVTLDQFLIKAWKSPVALGLNRGEIFKDILYGNVVGHVDGMRSEYLPTMFHLDFRKSPHTSKAYSSALSRKNSI